MKKLMVTLVAIVCVLILALLFVGTMKSADYASFEETNTTMLTDDKYVVYFYNEEDVTSSYLLEDIKSFSQVLDGTDVKFYVMDMEEKANKDYFAESTEQSGTDYPVTPEQANDLGIANFKLGGVPEMIYVEQGQVKNVGVGLQTSSMGNSYVSVQDTMNSIAKANELEFTAEYVYEN